MNLSKEKNLHAFTSDTEVQSLKNATHELVLLDTLLHDRPPLIRRSPDTCVRASRRDLGQLVAIFNFLLFLGSIAGYLFVLVHNAQRRRAVIATAITLPLPGCPSIHTGIEWAQWVPGKTEAHVLRWVDLTQNYLRRHLIRLRKGSRISLSTLLLRDNLVYFFGVACILVFNNLMVIGVTHIPWFSYGPFHAAVGILTTRMMINVQKAASKTSFISGLGTSEVAGAANPPTFRSVGGSWNVAQNSHLISGETEALIEDQSEQSIKQCVNGIKNTTGNVSKSEGMEPSQQYAAVVDKYVERET
ncbi:hypothetical protein FB446DRAFT_805569 [Lentinula raphanica]|nr:hypothetical protein FB446DRAFT_805569 [Lentinula raphanica]